MKGQQTMSLRFSQPPNGGQPSSDEDDPAFTTGSDGVTTPVADDESAAPTRPTFTATPGGPVTGTVPEPAPAPDDVVAGDVVPDDAVPDTAVPDDAVPDTAVPDTAAPDDMVVEDYAVNEDYAADESVRPAEPALTPAEPTFTPAEPDGYPAPATGTGAYEAVPAANGLRPGPAAAGPDVALLGDAAELRTRWQRAQAGFIDDPQEAVGEAADLIEQTAQSLVIALRQRQRELRVEWERRGDPGEPDAVTPDTEQLRLIMQRYRALFNQLCRP
jgi:hypothetical protein